MNQTIMFKKEEPLLTHAISRLRPDVFSHPVWIRFSRRDQPVPPETIKELLTEADKLQSGEPHNAFQLFLICAVYQNYSGHRSEALTTIQTALDLAERCNLSQEMLWGMWGAGAICLQHGDYSLAAAHFSQLQAVLYEQNEWMLADYIDVVKQQLLSHAIRGIENCGDAIDCQESDPLLSSTLDWLHRWGYSAHPHPDEDSNQPIGGSHSQESADESFCFTENHHGVWQTLKLMFQGELNIHWIKSSFPIVKHRPRFWESILRSLRKHNSDQIIDNPLLDLEPRSSDPVTTENTVDTIAPVILPAGQTPRMKDNSVRVRARREEITREIPVSVHMLGKFEMRIRDLICRLPASRSLSLLKYLMFYHKQNTPRDTLMDIFWPDASVETARNNLNVAMYNIRRALRQMTDRPVIVYKDGAYGAAPDLTIWLDVDEFERLVTLGQRLEAQNQLAAVSEYEAAVSIYQGDFLQENLYEGWTTLTRERLRLAYLKTLDSLSQIYFNHEQYGACISTCQLILARDCCREDAHCMLMRCYNHQGQDPLALRQYQACLQALRAELDVTPAPSTTQLYQQIRQHARV